MAPLAAPLFEQNWAVTKPNGRKSCKWEAKNCCYISAGGCGGWGQVGYAAISQIVTSYGR